MNKKIDYPKLWRYWTLGIFALSWIILVFIMKLSEWILIPVFIAYLIINSFIFHSYSLGILGNYYFLIQKNEKAFDIYKKAIAMNTNNVTTLYNYAVEILKAGYGKEALEYLQKAYKLNTKIIMEKNILLAMGSCYWVMNDIDKAIETLEGLKEKYSYVNSHVLTTLGYFYFLKDNYDKALEYSLDAIKDTPEHSAAWDNVGQIYFKQHDYKKAEESFLKAIEYKETMVDSLYYLGEIYEKENDKQKASEYFTKANNCNISALNTVTKKQVNIKYNEYKKYSQS